MTRMELCANQNEITMIIFLQSPFVCTLFVRLQIVANSCSRMRGAVFFWSVSSWNFVSHAWINKTFHCNVRSEIFNRITSRVLWLPFNSKSNCRFLHLNFLQRIKIKCDTLSINFCSHNYNQLFKLCCKTIGKCITKETRWCCCYFDDVK